MRLALVFSLSLSLLACGGSFEQGEPSPSTVTDRPDVPTPALASPCGDAHVVAKVSRTARALTTSGARFAFIDAKSDELPGSVVVREGDASTIVADEVDALSGSATMFAFTFADGGLGTYRAATSLRPGAHAFGIAADLAHVAWTHPTDDGFVLVRGDLDGEPETIAEHVFPVFAVDAGATFFTTFAPDATTVHRKRAHEGPEVVASDLPGVPSKMVAAGDRAFVALGPNPLLKEVGGPTPIDVWQGPIVDFAADAREVVVGLEHSIARVAAENGSAQDLVELGTCTVRSVAMNEQQIMVLARPERGDALVLSLAR